MTEGSISAALEREHHEIDGGIEAFSAGLRRGDTDPEPLLRAIRGLRRHIYLEEEFVFPPLKATLMMPIFVMLREHGEIWDDMDALEILHATNTDSETLLNACRELLAKLDAHNQKEEPIIYPQADAALDAEASAKLHKFLDSGVMPEGWRCEKAA